MKQETIDRIRKFTEDRDWDQGPVPFSGKSCKINSD